MQDAAQLEVPEMMDALLRRRCEVLRISQWSNQNKGGMGHAAATAGRVQLDALHVGVGRGVGVGGKEVVVDACDLVMSDGGSRYVSASVAVASTLEELVSLLVTIEGEHGATSDDAAMSEQLASQNITEECRLVSRSCCSIDYVEMKRRVGIRLNVAQKQKWRETGCLSLQNNRQRSHKRMRVEIDRRRNAKNTGDHIVLLDLVLAYQRYSSPSIHRTTAQLLFHCSHTRFRAVYTQILPLLLLNNPSGKHLRRFFLRQQITNTLHISLLHKVIQILVDRFLGGAKQSDYGSASLSVTSGRITHTNTLTKG